MWWLRPKPRRGDRKLFRVRFKLRVPEEVDATFRPMKAADLPRVCYIEHRNFGQTAWPQQVFEDELRNENARYYVLDVEGVGVVAYVGGWLILDELHVTNLSVAPSYQGKGLGRLTLKTFLDVCKLERPELRFATLEVRVSNHRAIRLYYSMGFRVMGLRRRYYSTGEDAYVMSLDMTGWEPDRRLTFEELSVEREGGV